MSQLVYGIKKVEVPLVTCQGAPGGSLMFPSRRPARGDTPLGELNENLQLRDDRPNAGPEAASTAGRSNQSASQWNTATSATAITSAASESNRARSEREQAAAEPRGHGPCGSRSRLLLLVEIHTLRDLPAGWEPKSRTSPKPEFPRSISLQRSLQNGRFSASRRNFLLADRAFHAVKIGKRTGEKAGARSHGGASINSPTKS